MADIKASINSSRNSIHGRLNPQKKIQVTQYQVDINNIKLSDLGGLDIGSATDGALLVYNSTSGNFEAKTEIDNTNTVLNGGFF
jgi:hypothetical protein